MDTLEKFKIEYKNFNERTNNLIAIVKNELGQDILRNISLDYSFDLDSLDYSIFENKIKDSTPLPLSNNKYKELIFSPKFIVNRIEKIDNTRNNSFTQGMYLLGRTKNSKPMLYSLSVVAKKGNPNDFSIKLYAVVKGEHKMLLRLDSAENDVHPNYVKDGKVVTTEREKVVVPTPHIHIASNEMSVLTQQEKSYSHAYYVGDVINKDECIKNGTYLNKCMEYMLDLMNVNTSINYENLNNLYKCQNVGQTKPIFDEQTFLYGNNVNSLHVYKDGVLRYDHSFHFTKIINNFSYETRNHTKEVKMAKINLPKSNRQLKKDKEL